MSSKRIVSILIALLNAILFVGLFLPFSGTSNVLKAIDPYSYIIIAFSVIGMLSCILNRKVELNFLTSGAIITVFVSSLIYFLREGGSIGSFKIGFFAYLISAILIMILSFVHGSLSGSTKHKIKEKPAQKTVAGNPTSNTNGVVQQTNSLNMNMPVNNFQSLPVTQVEKEKAPMDMLLSAQPAQQTNLITSHMNELGLHSVNISEDNPNGIDPNAMKAQPGVEVPINPGPGQIPSAFPTNLTQAPPMVNQAPAGVDVQQPIGAPVGGPPVGQPVGAPGMPPQPRPDLLAGSQMSGQMDNSPFNPATPQGPGQFL